MKGKKGIILGLVALLVVLAAAGFLIKGQRANETESTGESSNMTTSYNLQTDAEGLSKAVATLTLENGEKIQFRFFTEQAPNTVKRITTLIHEGFYNGIIFHRVVPGFVVQAGDPTGTGAGGSGVKLKAEFNSIKHEKGILSMARANDPDSADSQFFIMLGTHPHLDGKYTGFGKVISGLSAIDGIKQGDKIKSFTIE